jgi:uncharacterized membrane protein
MSTLKSSRGGIAENQPGTGRKQGDSPPGPYSSDLGMQGDVAPLADKSLTTFIGWFSIGLGAVQVLTPRIFLRLFGIKARNTNVLLTRVVGLREISSGIGIFAEPRPITWIQARIVGDAMDIMLLGRAFTSKQITNPISSGAALLSVLAITVVDLATNQLISNKPSQITTNVMQGSVMRVRKSVTVNRPIADVYAFWRNFENLPQFMRHIQSISVLENGRSHWVAQNSGESALEWEAVLVGDTPDEQITWQAVEDGDMHTDGSVQFRPAPGDRGTEVLVDIKYHPPVGKLGAGFIRLFGTHPEQLLYDELRMFKQIMETGEVVRSDGAVPGQKMGQRPAQPIPDDKSRTRNNDNLVTALVTGQRGSN